MANTHSIDLESTSSQNLTRTNTQLGLTLGGNITMELWFKPESTPSGGNTMTLCTTGMDSYTSPYIRYWIGYADVGGTVKLRFNRERACVSNNFTDYTVTLTNGTWYHIAMTYDGTNVRGYLDGSLVVGPTAQSGDGSGSCPANYDTCVGSMQSDSVYINFTDGLIDEVRIWSSVRSATEINDNKCVQIDSATGLRASWHLDNALTDSSGNSYTLTNNNTAVFTTDYPACFVTTGIGTVQGLAYASVGTVQGLAKASVGTIQGLA